ncbi:MAG: CCA tRNA nucleotidyltransferase [Lachnospiraceae bacterium]|nr:CCA tRNA nucleotidyltransferase [Lachnospiraceae bacterium]
MRTIELPEKVSSIIETLQDAGFEAFAVGGCVRDSLLEKPPHDWDITTSALPEQVKKLFRRTVDTGIAHGTVSVLLGKEAYEVTTYRIDGDYTDRRHPDQVTFTENLKEDLKRRDFTINAMAYSARDGVVDLFGGMEDLEKGIIRAVGVPQERFGEDALRILRAVRFSAQLDFVIEEETFRAAEALSGTMQDISAERIRDELLKILLSDHPERLAVCYQTGMTAVFLPEFDAMMQTPQNTVHHCYDVGTHTVESIRQIRPDPVLRLAMLFHDTGKPSSRTTDAEGRDHFYGHPVKSAEITEKALRRLKFDNETIRRVAQLVRWHDENPRLTKESVRRAIVKCGQEAFPALFEVKEADTLSQSEYRRQEKLDYIRAYEQLYREIMKSGDCLSVKDLAVKGADLMAAGVKPGPELGEILQKLLDLVLTDPSLNTKEQLLACREKL